MYGGVHVAAPLAGSFPRRRKSLRARVRERMQEAEKGGALSIIVALPLFLLGLVLMAGEEWVLGQTKVRPGTYVRVVSEPSGETAGAERGIVATLFRSNWGPLGAIQVLEDERQIAEFYGAGGAGGTTAVVREAFRGRARQIKALRLGTGGTKATLVLNAGVTPKVTLTAKYEGVRPNGWTVTKRTSLADATQNELITFEASSVIETITYTPGADDAAALVAAVNATSGGSRLWGATLNAAGAVDAVTQVAVAGGVDPTINGAALSAALGVIESEPFGVLVSDLEDATSHSTIDAWVERVRAQGKRIMAVVGEPTSVAAATRRTNAQAINNPAIVYVGNGFKTADGTIEGRYSAARVAGMIASASITESLTNSVVDGATELVGALSNSEIEAMINSGVLTFSLNMRRRVVVEYGITSLTALEPDQDAGWKKIRRTRTRDLLIDQIVLDSEGLRGRINNDKPGRDALVARMQGSINSLIRWGALVSGTVIVDPANAPAGDTAWFVIAVDDNDSIEKVYLTFGFRFSQPVAA